MLLEKHPTKHQVIRKSLKIPMSSFQNLKKEMSGDINNFKAPKCRNVVKINLTSSEKQYIKRLLKPLHTLQRLKKFKENVNQHFDTDRD